MVRLTHLNWCPTFGYVSIFAIRLSNPTPQHSPPLTLIIKCLGCIEYTVVISESNTNIVVQVIWCELGILLIVSPHCIVIMSIIIQANLHHMLHILPIDWSIQAIFTLTGYWEEINTLPHASARHSTEQSLHTLIGFEVIGIIKQGYASFVKLWSNTDAPLAFWGEPSCGGVSKILGVDAWWREQNWIWRVFDPINKERIRGICRVCKVLDLHWLVGWTSV